MNTYGYAGGDPINFSDPFGLSPCEDEEFENGCPTLLDGLRDGLSAIAPLAVAAYSLIETGVSATYGLATASAAPDETGELTVEPGVSIPGYGASIDRIIPVRPGAGPTTGSIWAGVGPNLGITLEYARGDDGQDVLSKIILNVGPSIGTPVGASVPFSEVLGGRRE